MSPESALGRFAPDPTGAPLVQIQLLGLPVRLVMAAREHHDGLMRELRLLALAGDGEVADLPLRLVRLVDILGKQYASARQRRDEEMTAAIARGQYVIDMVETVPATAGVAATRLRELVLEADAYCEQGVLVTTPRPEPVRRFGDWYIEQYVDQIAGRPPTRWSGPTSL